MVASLTKKVWKVTWEALNVEACTGSEKRRVTAPEVMLNCEKSTSTGLVMSVIKVDGVLSTTGTTGLPILSRIKVLGKERWQVMLVRQIRRSFSWLRSEVFIVMVMVGDGTTEPAKIVRLYSCVALLRTSCEITIEAMSTVSSKDRTRFPVFISTEYA